MTLGSTSRRVEALAAINGENALHVGLHAGAGIDRAWLELHFGSQGVVLDLPIPLERHLANNRVLDDDDDDRRALAADAHVLE